MSERGCDLAIVGGGLAGGLIALAVARAKPDVRVRLIEAGPAPGGHRRWSWFSTDLTSEGGSLMGTFRTARWNDGYDVHFPRHRRHVSTPYRSLSAADFGAGLAGFLPADAILANSPAVALDAAGVTLAGGERIAARAVIDCRGFEPTPNLNGGWQVFLGRYLRTDYPHQLMRPLVMDATVGQLHRFRFDYALPLSDTELLVEDTYYQPEPSFDREALERRLNRYAGRKGWKGEVIGEESGAVPVITGGDFEAWQAERRIDGVARAGAHAGFLHPLTGYTMPFAVDVALLVAREARRPGPELAALLEDAARQHWQATRFYRRLGSILFGAVRGSHRWRVFERFYKLRTAEIERFYAGRSTRADRLRILCARPPASPLRALRALASERPPLAEAE